MKIVLVMLAVLGLAGCASYGPTEVLSSSFSAAAPGTHAVTVESGVHVVSNVAPWTVFVDGEKAAQVWSGQAVTVHVPDGRHLVGITSRVHKNTPDMVVVVDVSATNQPILRATLCGAGFCGAELEIVSSR